MKFGIRKVSVSKSIAARTSLSRLAKNKLGLKAPRGLGWLTNPKKALCKNSTLSIFSSKFWNWFK